MQKIIFWIVAAIVLSAIIYYFSAVYERADYQHPMKRTSEVARSIA